MAATSRTLAVLQPLPRSRTGLIGSPRDGSAQGRQAAPAPEAEQVGLAQSMPRISAGNAERRLAATRGLLNRAGWSNGRLLPTGLGFDAQYGGLQSCFGRCAIGALPTGRDRPSAAVRLRARADTPTSATLGYRTLARRPHK